MTAREKITRLRDALAAQRFDGFIIPRADAFQGEYVPAHGARLAYLTGFDGSAGTAIVTADKAAFFTDGRYTIQARDDVDKNVFDIFSTSPDQGATPTHSPAAWIAENTTADFIMAIDPWLHTAAEAVRLRDSLAKTGGVLHFADDNPLDQIWDDRPPPPQAPAVPHPLTYAGESARSKRQRIADILETHKADTLVITLPEEICWLLNVRGGDVPCTPFVLSYALLHRNGDVEWFVDPHKITGDTRAWVGEDVTFYDLADFAAAVEKYARHGYALWADPAATPVAVENIILGAGGRLYGETSPLPMLKAVKNPTEIAGAKRAHLRDGIAVTKFLSRLDAQGAAAQYDELSAADLLDSFRRAQENYQGPSFDTISGIGGNGAIVHYRSTPRTNKPLTHGAVYLCDSGGQYLDGTTDITRTVAMDTPDDDMRENFTRVLKGHIQVALAVFPAGTTGNVIDARARAPLHAVGRDYAHGTGHGVGSYLSVHEGPCSISPLSKTVPLMPGMILSNEPGYYKENAYGIRIENLVVVTDTGRMDATGQKLFAFDTITRAPIDRRLIDTGLLTDEERHWLDNYHAQVRADLLPHLRDVDPVAADFLIAATAPL